MKRFETVVNGQMMAWVASDTLTISKKSGIVTMVNHVKPEDGPEYFLRTVFNLDVLPLYSYA